jgi:histidinol phosphatase-like PHP family hydrolase
MVDFPLVDYHVHLEGGVDLERAVQISKERGVQFGIVEHGGQGEGLDSDEALLRYIAELREAPVYKGMQAEGLDWPRYFSAEVVAQLDYVLSDALTFPEKDGTRVRLWTPQLSIPDAQDFMERYVAFNVQVIAEEPIDILANPTFLPEMLADQYDALWTPERMRRVIGAAVAHDVAIEINSRYRLPSVPFIRMAKEAGVRFSFGTNIHGEGVGMLDYCLEAVEACGLTREHLFALKPAGAKPIQTRSFTA